MSSSRANKHTGGPGYGEASEADHLRDGFTGRPGHNSYCCDGEGNRTLREHVIWTVCNVSISAYRTNRLQRVLHFQRNVRRLNVDGNIECSKVSGVSNSN